MSLRRHTTAIRSTQWTYYTVGRGQTLLIVPPFHSDINRIAPLIEYLGKYFRVIVPEFPGIATNEPLSGFPHTAKTYAMLMNEFIKKIKLRRYTSLTLSLGTVIAIRMFEMGAPMPRRLVVYGGPYDSQFVHPTADQRLALFFYQFVRHNKRHAEWFARNILGNRAILAITFGIRYLGYKKYHQIIRHQMHLTTTIHPRAWVEIIEDIFALRLSQESLHFPIQTLLVYNKEDNILDVPQTIAGMKRIFPNAKTKIMSRGLHAPAGPLSTQEVESWVLELLPLLGVKGTLTT